MPVTCPNCSSMFNLPDDHVPLEAKARCSICKHVFQVGQAMLKAAESRALSQAAGAVEGESVSPPDPAAPVAEEPVYVPRYALQKAAKGTRGRLIVILILFLVIAGGAGGYFFFRHSLFGGGEAATRVDSARLAREISISSRRQYLQENQYLGKIIVIDGVVVNSSDKPKNFIKLEAVLINPLGKVIMSKEFFCGPELKQAQLKTMGEIEMERWLTSETEIFRLNTGVNKGEQVPFMVVFYRPPVELLESAEGYSYRLTVTEAQNADAKSAQ